MRGTDKRKIALALEAMVAACALLGGVRITWAAMEYGLARLNACSLPARWVPAPPPPVRATSMLSAALELPDARPLKLDYPRCLHGNARPDWAEELLDRRIYIRPEIRGDRVVGFRVSGLHPGGPLERLGFQNGDVVLTINGNDLASPDHALEVYKHLKEATHFSIEIERNGLRMMIELDPIPSPVGGGGSGRGQALRVAAPADPPR